jgi:hypothetical protein
VNRGQLLEDRKLAALAVGVARRQQRFWRLAWLMGPALGLVQLTYLDPQVALLNAAIGTLTIAGLAAWFYLRARRAEQLNVAFVEGGSGGNRPRRHLPGRAGTAPATPDEDPDEQRPSATTTVPAGERPYRPRGRKRRR